MRNGSVNINLLEEFVYLANCLSFREAADHFYVSRSVISRHMTALEESIGARLLERDSRTVALTEAGEVFCREAKIVLRDWETALSHVREVQQGGATFVRVGYLRNAARPLLVHFMRAMVENHPDIRVSLVCMSYADLRRAMEERSIDIAIAMNVNPEISRNYRSTRIYVDDFYVVCAENHPLAAGKRPIKLEELKGFKVLLPDSLRDVGLTELPEALDVDSPEIARLFYDDIDVMNLKIQTEGCVALSSGLNGELFTGGIAMLSFEDVNTSFTVSAFYQDDFAGEAYRACRESFELCGSHLQK